MALALGLENKRKVAAVIVLFAVLIGVAVYVFFSGPSLPAPPPSGQTAPAAPASPSGNAPASGADAEKLSNAGIDPALHFDKLIASEEVRYEGARPQYLLRRFGAHRYPPTPRPGTSWP